MEEVERRIAELRLELAEEGLQKGSERELVLQRRLCTAEEKQLLLLRQGVCSAADPIPYRAMMLVWQQAR